MAAWSDCDRVCLHQRAHVQTSARELEHQRLENAGAVVRRQSADDVGGLHSGGRDRNVWARVGALSRHVSTTRVSAAELFRRPKSRGKLLFGDSGPELAEYRDRRYFVFAGGEERACG